MSDLRIHLAPCNPPGLVLDGRPFSAFCWVVRTIPTYGSLKVSKLLRKLSLILGGANSGKSSFAENIILQSGLAPVYIATAQAFDEEMKSKISAHQKARGPEWETLEAPLDLSAALKKTTSRHAVLIDCATLWLTNFILADRDVGEVSNVFLNALDEAPGPVVVVSNETGQGIVPENALARRFRSAQGRLNQAIAAEADLAVLIVAGLPMTLKGDLP